MAGRPPTWADKISAPEEAFEFYRMLMKVQSSPAFFPCHVFDGAVLNHIPYGNIQGVTKPIPQTILSFLGLGYGKRTCPTSGCINPLHFVAITSPEKQLKTLPLPPPDLTQPTKLEDYLELIQYHLDEDENLPLDFESLRQVIPLEDLSDELLNLSIEKLKNEPRL